MISLILYKIQKDVGVDVFLKVGVLNFDDLLQPVPEPGAGKLDLLPRQLVEDDGDAVLQLGQGVAGRPISVNVAGIAVNKDVFGAKFGLAGNWN